MIKLKRLSKLQMISILIFMICITFIHIYTMINDKNFYKINGNKQIACGYWHCMKLDDNGHVWASGANWYGQIGNGSKNDNSTFTKVSNVSEVISIACGACHSVALKKDGTVWTWGANFDGQLGNGTKEVFVTLPRQVKGLNGIIAISCGDSHCVVLKKDGTVWTWGYNNKGQLGNGKLENSYLPTKVVGLEGVIEISAGLEFSMALKKDGTIWGWGSNGNGQLGNGSINNKNIPTRVKWLTGITSISCGDNHVLSLKNDGTVWAWGGETPLGNGSLRASSVPILVKNIKNIADISANYNNSMAIEKNGTVWAWGKNWKGQIGNGSTIIQKTPIVCISLPQNQQIGDFTTDKSLKYCVDVKYVKKGISNFNKNKSDKNILTNKTYSFFSEERFSEQWGLYNQGQMLSGIKCKPGIDINIIPAWELVKDIELHTIGILDTGVDINHQELLCNIFTNVHEIPNNGIDDDGNGYLDDVNGWDFVNNDKSVFDSNESDSHGTLVAGIISSKLDGKGIVGVTPKAKIMPLKFMDGNSGNTLNIIKAIEYAQSMDIKIINCSWAWEDIKYNSVIENAIKDSNLIFICSAGNKNSSKLPTQFYPACFDLDNIISVASVNYYGVLDPTSNFGTKITVSAPGVSILSTAPNNKYELFYGTSAATPFVAAITNLIKSYRKDLSNLCIIDIIKNSTQKSKDLNGKTEAGGIINAYNAIKLAMQYP